MNDKQGEKNEVLSIVYSLCLDMRCHRRRYYGPHRRLVLLVTTITCPAYSRLTSLQVDGISLHGQKSSRKDRRQRNTEERLRALTVPIISLLSSPQQLSFGFGEKIACSDRHSAKT